LREFIQVPLLILMGMVALVTLMACANVASLLLVRVASRMREMSVRYALGAKRRRVVRQLLVEGLILGFSGGLLGVLIAPQVAAFLTRQFVGGTGDLPFSSHLDLRILSFNFALALVVSIIFSLVPAIQFWRPNLMNALKQQMVTAAGGPLRFRRMSVAVQVGLSLLLLVGAGLFVRTLRNLKSVDLGFAPDHLLTFTINPGFAGYKEGQSPAVYQQVIERLRGLPGIRSVGATNSPELNGDASGSNITVSGYDSKPDENMDVAQYRIMPGYFAALAEPLLAGRKITEQDNASSARVAVVNEAFARYFFGGPEQAVGQAFGWGGGKGTKTNIQIIGVVINAKHRNVRDEIERTVFEPYVQNPRPGPMSFYIRTTQAPQHAESAVRVAMQDLDSKLALSYFHTLEEQLDENLSLERMIALLASSFAILTLFMAAVGLYGVLAYSTAQRTREIGLRVALGASRGSVLKMVLTEVLWLAGVGIVVALPLTLLLTRTLRSQLYGISSSDPWTISSVTVLLAAVAILSALLPARRAAKVEPMVALRYE
jgi:putative ABC transport system permease protein